MISNPDHRHRFEVVCEGNHCSLEVLQASVPSIAETAVPTLWALL